MTHVGEDSVYVKVVLTDSEEEMPVQQSCAGEAP